MRSSPFCCLASFFDRLFPSLPSLTHYGEFPSANDPPLILCGLRDRRPLGGIISQSPRSQGHHNLMIKILLSYRKEGTQRPPHGKKKLPWVFFLNPWGSPRPSHGPERARLTSPKHRLQRQHACSHNRNCTDSVQPVTPGYYPIAIVLASASVDANEKMFCRCDNQV